mgnify:CR=1 FL=1
MWKMRYTYQTGYALSGGFIRGFAHLGVIQSLLEHDIHPDILAGVSAGALAGVFYADGHEPHQTLDYFSKLKFFDFTKPIIPRLGFLSLDELIDFLRSHLRHKTLETLPLPFIVSATDFDHGHIVHFRTGSIAERVAASCCIPPLFTPVVIDGINYVDGGVFMNLPVPAIRDLCRTVIGVNVSPMRPEEYKRNILSVTLRAFHFMAQANTVNDRSKCDMLIEPHNLYEYGNTELDKAEDIFMQGYAAANAILDTTEPTKTSIFIRRAL